MAKKIGSGAYTYGHGQNGAPGAGGITWKPGMGLMIQAPGRPPRQTRPGDRAHGKPGAVPGRVKPVKKVKPIQPVKPAKTKKMGIGNRGNGSFY